MSTEQDLDSRPEDVEPDNPQESFEGGKAVEPGSTKKAGAGIQPSIENDAKSTWWPNCTHSRYSKLATRKFRDRIVILWKCRRCPRQVREIIDIDMNSRNVFVKSTKSALPRRFDEPNQD